MNRRNPLLTREYYQALYRFHKQHPGAVPAVFGTPKKKKYKRKKTSAGRKDASAPVARVGGPPARRSDELSNQSGVGNGIPPWQYDGDRATISRALEATPTRVDEDRQGR